MFRGKNESSLSHFSSRVIARSIPSRQQMARGTVWAHFSKFYLSRSVTTDAARVQYKYKRYRYTVRPVDKDRAIDYISLHEHIYLLTGLVRTGRLEGNNQRWALAVVGAVIIIGVFTTFRFFYRNTKYQHFFKIYLITGTCVFGGISEDPLDPSNALKGLQKGPFKAFFKKSWAFAVFFFSYNEPQGLINIQTRYIAP